MAPRQVPKGAFFEGAGAGGAAPGLWTLTLSQVTSWIFTFSLMNAAILGYFYGIAGVLAYTACYGSFLTGAFVVGRIRAGGGRSVQDWLSDQFRRTGTISYNIVIALTLLSEVFANLLVVGLIFSALLPDAGLAGPVTITVAALVALGYSAWGGLAASLRTDVVQMLAFLVVFALAFAAIVLTLGFSIAEVLTAPGTAGGYNGLVLLAVAGLQVFSYPLHDPAMMDGGFLADPRTARRSFLNGFWISALCILGFGLLGLQASLKGAAYEGELIGTWAGMFPGWVFVALLASLLISALSTLDSALASAARLMVEELRVAPRSLMDGRATMVVLLIVGGALTLWGNATLFEAVAVSGTASMFLTPVILGRLVPSWRVTQSAYLVALGAAMAGAAAYLFRYAGLVAAVLPDGHKYEQLLAICIAVLITGIAAVVLSTRASRAGVAATPEG